MKMWRKKGIPWIRLIRPLQLALLFTVVASGSAREPSPSFQRLNVQQGLSQGSITAILQDHKGFMWFGTYDGLNRFDGVEFTVYRHHPDDPQSLSDNWITCLHEDSENVLWVGTQRGLNRFDRRTGRFVRYPRATRDGSTASTDYPVHVIFSYRRETVLELWVGIPDLHRLDPRNGSFYALGHHGHDRGIIFDGSIAAVQKDHDGSVWLGSGGYFRFDPRTRSIHDFCELRTDISSILFPNENDVTKVWIGTVLNGLLQHDRMKNITTQLSPSRTTSLLKDHSGQIWVGTEGGLQRWKRRHDGRVEVAHFRNEAVSPSSLSDDYISKLYEDRLGALWVGTQNGLNRLDPFSPSFKVYRRLPENPNSLGHDFVLPIVEDRSGNIWFGTLGAGVSVLRRQRQDQEKFSHIRHEPRSTRGLSSDNVRSILQDRAGTIWIGTSNGLDLYNSTGEKLASYRRVPPENSLNFWADSLCEGQDGTIWAGVTEGGLIGIERTKRTGNRRSINRSEADPQGGGQGLKFTNYPLPTEGSGGIPFGVHVIAEDHRRMLWVGTTVGLFEFDPRSGTHTKFAHQPDDPTSLSNNNVWSIHEDPSEAAEFLWVGTSQGLNRFDIRTKKFRPYLEQEGFPSACVYGILRDDWGRLWLSTNHGLTVFDDRKPEGKKFKNYDVSDGIQGNEFNRRSYCRLRSGEFLFGGTNGVTRFHPLRIRDNPHAPPVVLTAFSKSGGKVELDRDTADISTIRLNYNDTAFSFEFVALNYTNASKNRYAYMMEGFDRDWIHSGTRRFANYTHIDPGEYVFRAKASNNDGIWNEAGIAVRVIITPPFWGTWWFRGLMGAAFVASLIALYRSRIGNLERKERAQQEFTRQILTSQEQERARIAGELHDSLVQNLLVAKNRSLMGLRRIGDRGAVERELNEISGAMTNAIDEVREIAHNLRPYQLDRLGLTRAILSLGDTLEQTSGIRFALSVENIDPYFSSEQSILLYRIIQEAASNILRHSEACEAEVGIRKDPAFVTIRIRDNGKGLPADRATTRSFGLSGISQRVQMLGGRFSVESWHGQGTTLLIDIPVGKEAR